MENKNVGLIITGIALLMGVIVWIFNNALKRIVGDTCTHGDSCSMYDTIAIQTWVSLAIVGVILIIGIVIMFWKPKEKVIVKTIKEKKKKKDYSGLEKKEKEVVDLLLNEGNAMFQADLMEKLNIGKVGATRLLDKLESKQIIERKRRGMNNLVVLRD
jgi:putative component of membrane protein insertase Oxa1/YidC/SpoIIIJ protein YidD